METQKSLAMFRRAPLPRLFSIVSPWWLAGLALGLHAAAVFLLPLFTRWSVAMETAAGSFGATLLVVFLLHLLGGRLARPRAQQ